MPRVPFNQNLRNARIRAGFATMRDFAEAVGISENKYARYERGENEPSLELLSKICATLQISVNELINESPPDARPSSHPKPGNDTRTGNEPGPSNGSRQATEPTQANVGFAEATGTQQSAGATHGTLGRSEQSPLILPSSGRTGHSCHKTNPLDVLLWRFVEAYAHMAGHGGPTAGEAGRAGGNTIVKVAQLFTQIRNDALGGIAAILASRELAAAANSDREKIQRLGDELVSLILRETALPEHERR